jgi:hypothetical protein
LLSAALFVVPFAAHAEPPAAAPPTPAAQPAPAAAAAPGTAAAAPVPASGVPVELSADDQRATLERRVATSTPSGIPLLETGVISLGHWEHACVAPCADVKLDPRFAYRVAGDGLVPTDSFSIPRDGRVKVDAKMGSSFGRVTGVLATAGGGALLLGGALALAATPILENNDVGSKGFRSAVLAGGVGAISVGAVAATVGLVLWLTNGSSAHTEIASR